MALASGIAIVGIFSHRLNLVLNGLSVPNIKLPPGLPIGVAQDDPSYSFAMYQFYVPTIVEWLVVIGILAFGALVFTVLARYLPMQEPEAH